ncbi:MAG: hypothetical protein R3331_10290 [Sulfurospirillaceae bacterium]|nr:hypothetical protein [Sulfurospirillaceae bacterium]
MMMTINKLSLLYLIGDIILIVTSLFIGKFWLINTQAAFICSMLVTFSSYFSYKIMIEKRIDSNDIGNNKDSYDALEDPYNLFNDDDNEENVIEREQKPKKEGKFKNIIKGLVTGISGALSIYRLLAYLILFVVILSLIRNSLFDAVAFFVGLSVVPLVSLLSGLARH